MRVELVSLLRRIFASRPVHYAGLKTAVNSRRLGLKFFPSTGKKDNDQYEAGLISGLTETLSPGDKVVVVGGGLGVTVAFSALRVGNSGQVTCFEGSRKCVRQIGTTLERNNVPDNVTVKNTIVAENIGVYNKDASATILDPADLPECDVLEMDCEGAETQILPKLKIRPRTILVETHGCLGASSVEVREQLESIGYEVTSLGVAEPDREEFCLENDILVLLANKTCVEQSDTSVYRSAG